MADTVTSTPWEVLEAMPDATLVVDERGVVAFANTAAAELFGRPQEALVGIGLEQLVPERLRAHHEERRQAYQHAPRRRPMGGAEMTALRGDGLEVPVEIMLSPTTHAGHRFVVAAVRDISTRRAAERMATLGELAAGVAHEINNPLSAIVANLAHALELMPAGQGGHSLDEALRDAVAASERVRLIARDLLSFSRPGDEIRAPVDLRAVVLSTIRLCGTEVRHRARLVTDLPHGVWAWGDESRLGQVMMNLILNAAQAIPEGRADAHEICVAIRRVEDHAEITVTDDGEGIAEAHRAAIFQPFFTTKKHMGGTGLGLPVCARIVASHGGEIRVDSSPGRGTTFTIALPLAPVTTPDPRPAPSTTTARSGRVLVVDDEDLVSSAIARLLRPHAVVVCHSVDAALATIERDPSFDAILCDLMMPGRTAEDLLVALHARFPQLHGRTVVMTGGAVTEATRAFLAGSNVRILEKPFTGPQLHALLHALLGRSSAT